MVSLARLVLLTLSTLRCGHHIWNPPQGYRQTRQSGIPGQCAGGRSAAVLGGPRVHLAGGRQRHEVARGGADRRDVLAVERRHPDGVLDGEAAAARELELEHVAAVGDREGVVTVAARRQQLEPAKKINF